jgi:hypothetical protein
MCATSRAEAHEFTASLGVVFVAQSLPYRVVFSRSLFFSCHSVFFWPLYCLYYLSFFHWRLLISPSISSNCSYSMWHYMMELVSVHDTTLCDKVSQWLATGRWVSPGTPVYSTNKTDCHDIIEILLKVALNTINHKPLRTYLNIKSDI